MPRGSDLKSIEKCLWPLQLLTAYDVEVESGGRFRLPCGLSCTHSTVEGPMMMIPFRTVCMFLLICFPQFATLSETVGMRWSNLVGQQLAVGSCSEWLHTRTVAMSSERAVFFMHALADQPIA